MTSSLAVVINVVLDTAIVVAILSLLAWGIIAHRRDHHRATFAERRRGFDRRRSARPVHVERRRGERRSASPLTA